MRGIVASGAFLAALACAREPSPDRVTRWDSAGVEIVASSAPRWEAEKGWEVADTPLLDLTLTGSGPAHEFDGVRGVMRLEDGRFVVADQGSKEIRFYSSDGQHLQSTGRDGEGPGEFRRLETISRFRADSIAVYDFWLARVTVLDSQARVGRIISLRGVADRVRQLQVLSDSVFIGASYSSTSVSDEMGRYRMPYSVVRLRADGTVIDTIATVGGFEGFQFSMGDAGLPYGKDGHLAARGSTFVIGSADEMGFDRYDGEPPAMTRVRAPTYPLGVPGSELDQLREILRDAEMPAELRQIYEDDAARGIRPGYSDLLLDELGFVWAAEFRPSFAAEVSKVWEVFSPTGEWLGATQVPDRFTIFEIGADYILGVFRDELDVEHVQLLRLNRR